ncbi:hypothetical protein ECG_03735 [Echinococcus granulosus]|uniref:histone acetyltransferase n=2 Tax=Echinococcus granulosus TaxID=6210 RepID=A0A068WE26_ECHGR|nr:hypothetical protein ECG_03735 [Echinococcus granulosus]CDS18004.1 CREB binding protein [Echinococcus granulosus]
MADDNSDTKYPATASSPTDPQLVLFQQQYLRLLLHAYCCHQGQMLSMHCTTQNCDKAWHLLEHIEKCERGVDCDTPYCTISKDLISHWRMCTDEKCVVCAPVTFIPSQQSSQPHSNIISQSSECGCLVTDQANANLESNVLHSAICNISTHLSAVVEAYSQSVSDEEFAKCSAQYRGDNLEEMDWRAEFDVESRGLFFQLM